MGLCSRPHGLQGCHGLLALTLLGDFLLPTSGKQSFPSKTKQNKTRDEQASVLVNSRHKCPEEAPTLGLRVGGGEMARARGSKVSKMPVRVPSLLSTVSCQL